MSFVKKSLKKAWNFVKKNWKPIVLVAAIAFTAGVATIGFGAFAGAQGVGGFLGAVGQTMWAGIAGTAGSMGIGSGATVPVGSALAAQGVTHVGLGAAWGAGSGYGLGMAGKAAATQAASLVPAINPAASAIAETAVKTGLTLDKAMKYAAIIGPIVGPMLMAAGQEEELNQYNIDAAFGGVQFTGPRAEGSPGPGRNWLAEGFDVASPEGAGPGSGTFAANEQFQNQMQRNINPAFSPLMSRGVTGRGLDGRLLPAQKYRLMGA